MNQRWRERKSTFRRPEEQIRTEEYDVARLADDRLTKPFVLAHHYSATYPAARFRFGLFRRGELAGVAVFSHPVNDATLTGVFGGAAAESVELGRFVLLDEVPGNGETWFLGHCLRDLRRGGLLGVVSFSDPQPRTTAGGEVCFPGHVGTIYQAANAHYLGRSRGGMRRLLPDGTVFSERAVSKIRTLDQGWMYAVRQLEVHGADAGDLTRSTPDTTIADEWLSKWLPLLTRPFRHHGNHKYAWPFGRATRQETLPYPMKNNDAPTTGPRSQ